MGGDGWFAPCGDTVHCDSDAVRFDSAGRTTVRGYLTSPVPTTHFPCVIVRAAVNTKYNTEIPHHSLTHLVSVPACPPRHAVDDETRLPNQPTSPLALSTSLLAPLGLLTRPRPMRHRYNAAAAVHQLTDRRDARPTGAPFASEERSLAGGGGLARLAGWAGLHYR